MGDCMCIGIEAEKPDTAVADPSRMIIKNIVPTYATSESFLQSAKFQKKQESNQDRYSGHRREATTT